MTSYRLLRRLDYETTALRLPETVRRKADWAQVLLGTRGRTPTVKNTTGQNAQWRRTPVQGSHYYLWWIPIGESGLALDANGNGGDAKGSNALLVHSIRHHDETNDLIEVGELAQYGPVDLGLLDPRFDDQAQIGRDVEASDLALSVIEGMPGSGKSVALLFLARDLAFRPGVRKVRYITYTERLKRAAREIFDALGPEIAKHITVHTVNDVVRSLLEKELSREAALRAGPTREGPDREPQAIVSTPYSELRTFARTVEAMNPRDLGVWRAFPLTLYTELRAEIVGRTFPAGYQLPTHRDEQLRRHGGEIDVARYARRRGLDPQSAQQAVDLANRLRGRYFSDQVLAARALDKVVRGDIPAWLAHTDAVIVDEVQDLTLVQIALIAEMARLRAQKHPEKPLAVTVAGDESQIVQPTGFKWGVTKDLFKERLGVLPARHEFAEQRRSPALLARLVSGSWSLYAQLPKELRPSARQPAEPAPHVIGEDTEPGLAALVPPPEDGANDAWRGLLDELDARPGRVLIDLTERLQIGDAAGEGDAASEVLFAAREIKGLERATVIVHGLETLYQRVITLTGEDHADRIEQLEARRLIDQMRVALSRSTNRLILLEEPSAAVFAAIGFDPTADALALSFPELIEFLGAEEMTESEMVFGLLGEADDLADRERIDEAMRRNRRATAVAQRLASADLMQRSDEQYARLLLIQSEALLASGRVEAAQEAFQARAGLPQADDVETQTRAAHLGDRLAAAADSAFDTLLLQGQRALASGDLDAAVAAGDRALRIAEQTQVPGRYEAAVRLFSGALEASALALAEARDAALSPQVAALLRRQSAVEESQERTERAQALRVLAARYEDVPARSGLADMPLLSVLQSVLTHLALLGNPPAHDLAHSLLWLDETFVDLGERVRLYYKWASTAATLARSGNFPQLDEHIWELENRLEQTSGPASDHDSLRLRAFLADYNDKPDEASLLWEQAGATDQAIESAREAGDLERAHALLRRHNPSAIPDALAIAVKVVRQLVQLEQKHRSLTPAERAALLEQIARVHDAIAASVESED